ncbi:acyltransferase, partial [Streptomyces sp. UMAF16]|nr:acyltransferase [Streptomyces sp. UMAF16]
LDGLRGVAVLMVLVYHLGLAPGGFLGVDVFFVLSGFLITSMLVEEWQRRDSISLRRFYARRALRLLPAFLVLLVICLVEAIAIAPTEEKPARLKAIGVAACYLSNYPPLLPATDMSLLGHTWSLSLEEQFYLLWPLCLFFMLRTRLSRGRLVAIVCAGIAASATYPSWRMRNPGRAHKRN